MNGHDELEALLQQREVRALASGFGWRDTDEIFRGELPNSEWVVPGLQWGPGRPNGMWGYGGSGKSYLAASAALAVAAGVPALGRFEVRQGRVDILDYEMGYAASATRLRRLARGMGLDVDALVADGRVRLCDMPALYLNSGGVEDALAREFEGRDLCVIDSLRRATPGEDENASSMSNYLDVLTRTSNRTGTTFVLIHHSGKGGGGDDARQSGRGSSAILDGSGSVHLVQNANGGDQRYLKHVRAHASGSGVEDDLAVLWTATGEGDEQAIDIRLVTLSELDGVRDQERIDDAERKLRKKRKWAFDLACGKEGVTYTEYQQLLVEGGLSKADAKAASEWLVANKRIALLESEGSLVVRVGDEEHG